MGRRHLQMRIFGCTLLLTVLLVVQYASPGWDFLSPSPGPAPAGTQPGTGGGRRSLKTGNMGPLHKQEQEEIHQTEEAILKTIEENIIILDSGMDPRIEAEEIILNRRLEIQRSFNKSPTRQLPSFQSKNGTKTLFTFADFKPGQGQNSKPVLFGVNRTIDALSREFDSNKFSNGKINPRWRTRDKETPSTMQIADGLPVGTKLQSNQSRHILIATSWRSGSTFLGDLLNHYPGAFYYFEPLHYGPMEVAPKLERMEFLKSLFVGSFSSKNLGFLHHVSGSKNRFLFKNHNTRLWKSCYNLLPRETMCFMPDYLNAVTALYPIKLMKTVRLRVSDTEQLLLDPELNLKVVVLVRDPRGVYASRSAGPIAAWCKKDACADPVVGCEDIFMDVQSAKDLEKRYPGRVFLIRYEDLSVSTEEVAKSLLRFLDLPWTPEMTNFIVTHTSMDKKETVRNRVTKEVKKQTSPYSTSRNSTATAFKWRTGLDWGNITTIQNSCSKLMDSLGYVSLKDESETKSEKFPITMTPQELWPSWS